MYLLGCVFFVLMNISMMVFLLAWTQKVESKWDGEDMKKWQASKADVSPRKGYIPDIDDEIEWYKENLEDVNYECECMESHLREPSVFKSLSECDCLCHEF